MNDSPKTIADVERLAAQAGITFMPEDYAEAYKLMESRRQQMEDQAKNQGKLAAIFALLNRLFPQFLRSLIAVGDVCIMVVQTIFVGPGLLIILAMLLGVEQQRLFYGLSLFETHEGLATFGAVVLVSLNLSLELWAAYVEHRAGWIEPPQRQFSLQILKENFSYWAGRDQSVRPKSPAAAFKAGLRLVTITILILAAAGSMQTIISSAKGNWWDAVVEALSKSSLSQMMAWAGGLLFAITSVKSAQLVSNYAARKAIEIGAALAAEDIDKAIEAAGLSGATHLLARLKHYQRERRAMSSAEELPAPRENSLPVSSVDTPDTALDRAMHWLDTHRDTSLTVQGMADDALVSKSTMQRARKARKSK